MTWDPTRRRASVVRELECSRDENGVAQATVTLTQWGARERLAYQDRSMAAMQIVIAKNEETGEDVHLRRIKPSELTLTHLALTVTACTGFPPVDGVPFDWTRREHVETLTDADVLEEVALLAAEFQPAPTGEVKRPRDRKPAGPPPAATPETAGDFHVGEDEPDPSRTL